MKKTTAQISLAQSYLFRFVRSHSDSEGKFVYLKARQYGDHDSPPWSEVSGDMAMAGIIEEAIATSDTSSRIKGTARQIVLNGASLTSDGRQLMRIFFEKGQGAAKAWLRDELITRAKID